jgi:hypothetical protein
LRTLVWLQFQELLFRPCPVCLLPHLKSPEVSLPFKRTALHSKS